MGYGERDKTSWASSWTSYTGLTSHGSEDFLLLPEQVQLQLHGDRVSPI